MRALSDQDTDVIALDIAVIFDGILFLVAHHVPRGLIVTCPD